MKIGPDIPVGRIQDLLCSAPWLRVLAISDMVDHAFERWVNPADVVECQAPSTSAFAKWVLSGSLPSTEIVFAAAGYGSLCVSYFDKYAPDGNLTSDWRANG